MGYTTEFQGEIRIDPPLNDDEISFLNDLAGTRRMMRKLGPLFVGGSGFYGQGDDADIIDSNTPSGERLDRWSWRTPVEGWIKYYEENGQPGLWLQWRPNDDGTALRWDGGEKFYNSEEWMRYLIDKLLSPMAGDYLIQHGREDERLSSFTYDHTLNGVIHAQGEEDDDMWKLVVENNVVTAMR